MRRKRRNVLLSCIASISVCTVLTSMCANAAGEWRDNDYLKDKSVEWTGALAGYINDDYGLLLENYSVNKPEYTSYEAFYFNSDYSKLACDMSTPIDVSLLKFQNVFIVDGYDSDVSLKQFVLDSNASTGEFEEINSKLPEDAVISDNCLFVLREALDDITFDIYYGVPDYVFNTSFSTEGSLYKFHYVENPDTLEDTKKYEESALANRDYVNYFNVKSKLEPFFDSSGEVLYPYYNASTKTDGSIIGADFVYNVNDYSVSVNSIDSKFIDSFELVKQGKTDSITHNVYEMVGAKATVSLGTLLKQSRDYEDNVTSNLVIVEDGNGSISVLDKEVLENLVAEGTIKDYTLIGTSTQDVTIDSKIKEESIPAISLTFNIINDDASVIYINGSKPCVGSEFNPCPLIKAPTAELLNIPEVIKGDVDGNGGVDILDVIIINKAILGKENLSDSSLKSADVNGNGVPDSTDSLSIMKFIVGLITKL